MERTKDEREMLSRREANCGKCALWDNFGTGGYCRAKAPTQPSTAPITSAGYWCGEFIVDAS